MSRNERGGAGDCAVFWDFENVPINAESNFPHLMTKSDRFP
ncbi:MAG: hypothetical protein ACTSU5_14995 [Promethearchaeota archaeon]